MFMQRKGKTGTKGASSTELLDASRELQKQSQRMHDEVDAFLRGLDVA